MMTETIDAQIVPYPTHSMVEEGKQLRGQMFGRYRDGPSSRFLANGDFQWVSKIGDFVRSSALVQTHPPDSRDSRIARPGPTVDENRAVHAMTRLLLAGSTHDSLRTVADLENVAARVG